LSLLSTGNEIAGEITKAAPPVSVAGLGLAGVSLNQWVLIATLIYTVLQIVWFIYSKFIRGERNVSR
jgi:hypothetical protein